MEVEVIVNAQWVVKADGEIDLSNADKLATAIQQAVHESPKGIIVDLSSAVYIDSAGIQVILAGYRHVLTAGGQFAVVVGHPNVHEIFEIINADRFPNFSLCDNLEKAESVLARSQVHHE
jgi:anti-anti-sigma factor